MIKKYARIYTLLLLFVFSTVKGQNKTHLPPDTIKSESKEAISFKVPNTQVRTIKQDRKGNIWLASDEGIIRYDGKSFTNITNKVSSDNFFSLLEDRKGNFWFATYGSGVYHYDGKSFLHFTTKQGLANDWVSTIYEVKTGSIWFGANGAVSRYDGESFQNFTIKGDFPNNDVTSIMEDKRGNFWFCTRGYAYVYNGKTFTRVTNKEGKAFTNVWSIIEDKKGAIWLGVGMAFGDLMTVHLPLSHPVLLAMSMKIKKETFGLVTQVEQVIKARFSHFPVMRKSPCLIKSPL